MRIDESELNRKLRKHHRAYAKLKKKLQNEIAKHVRRKKPTDLGWLCNQTGLSPKDATALYHLLYDKIPRAPKGGYNLSSKSIDSLVLSQDEYSFKGGAYKLNIDPEYVFRIVLVSDTHIGSRYDTIEALEEMFDRAQRVGAQAIFHAGDITDGIGKHSDSKISLRGDCLLWEQQLERVVSRWPHREGIVTYFIAGNHDLWAWELIGADICKHIARSREDMVYLKLQNTYELELRKNISHKVLERLLESREMGTGRIGAVRIGPYHLDDRKKNTILMMYHPGGGSAMATSYKPQRMIANLENLLHAFDNMRNRSGRRIKPHIVLIGHYHKADHGKYRNVHVFQGGTMKRADPFHEHNNLRNEMGYWVVELATKKNGDIVGIAPRFFEAYVRKDRSTRSVVTMK